MSQSLALRATSAAETRPLRREASHFKMPPDSQFRTRTVAPDSVEWNEFGISKRLAHAPYLEPLVRSGKASIAFCESATSTCEEKALAAGLHPDSVIKAIHAREVFSDERHIVVASGPRRIRLSSVLSEACEGSSIKVAEDTPPGMAHGTCTPFVSDGVAASLTFIGVESPHAKRTGKKGRVLGTLGDIEADVSIGGTDELAHRLSIRMRYADFVDALKAAYGDKVVLLAEVERL
jgi:hypothetical protein